MSLKTFLAARNIEFSLRRYGVEALNYMTLGLFGSLVIGLILKTVGGWTGIEALVEAGTMAQQAMGAAIGVAVAYGLQGPPIVIFASAAISAAIHPPSEWPIRSMFLSMPMHCPDSGSTTWSIADRFAILRPRMDWC